MTQQRAFPLIPQNIIFPYHDAWMMDEFVLMTRLCRVNTIVGPFVLGITHTHGPYPP